MSWLEECKEKLPKDLLEEYYEITLKVKEAGIPEKLKSGEPLTFREQLMWQNWKNLNQTLKTICLMIEEKEKYQR